MKNDNILFYFIFVFRAVEEVRVPVWREWAGLCQVSRVFSFIGNESDRKAFSLLYLTLDGSI